MSGGSKKRSRARNVGRPKKIICDGTVADYQRHYRRGEKPCLASREAWRDYYDARGGRTAKKRIPEGGILARLGLK